MNESLSERLAQAAYAAWWQGVPAEKYLPWEELDHLTQERYRHEVEAVTKTLLAEIIPQIQGITAAVYRYILGGEEEEQKG